VENEGENERVQLRREIATLKQQIAALNGMPDAQRPLRIALGQREQRLAELLGWADRGPALPSFSLIKHEDRLQIIEDGQVQSLPSPLRENRLADLFATPRNELLAIASDLGNGHYAKNVTGTPALCREALQRLANAGYYLWQMIFSTPELNRIAVRVRERGRASPLQLNLITPTLAMPWHLIYDRDPSVGVDLDGFWGLRHILMIASQDTLPEHFLPDDNAPLTALAGYYLPFATESGDPQLIERQQALVRQLIPQTERISSDAELLDRLRTGSDARLVYLFCHVANAAPVPGASRLPTDGPIGTAATRMLLTKNGGINLTDLWQAAPIEHAPQLRGRPLVILNACASAAQSPLSDIGLISFFFQRGAQALIGSECKVPVIFGDVFGTALLEALLVQGQSVGAAIRDTRRMLIERDANPLGMIYSLLGRADMRLVAAHSSTVAI